MIVLCLRLLQIYLFGPSGRCKGSSSADLDPSRHIEICGIAGNFVISANTQGSRAIPASVYAILNGRSDVSVITRAACLAPYI